MEQGTLFTVRRPKGREPGGGKAPRAPALPRPGAPVSRELDARLRPLQCASRVIDAGRGLARAMPTVRGGPSPGRPQSTFRRGRGRRRHPAPPLPGRRSNPRRWPPVKRGAGYTGRMRAAPRLDPNVSSGWAREAAGRRRRSIPYPGPVSPQPGALPIMEASRRTRGCRAPRKRL